ncbi:hypothetical protein J6590_055954 [Homalodisca vitripennis]|nr:hypothetical protein J6590_055954 [Homalodisca vitripennis]
MGKTIKDLFQQKQVNEVTKEVTDLIAFFDPVVQVVAFRLSRRLKSCYLKKQKEVIIKIVKEVFVKKDFKDLKINDDELNCKILVSGKTSLGFSELKKKATIVTSNRLLASVPILKFSVNKKEVGNVSLYSQLEDSLSEADIPKLLSDFHEFLEEYLEASFPLETINYLRYHIKDNKKYVSIDIPFHVYDMLVKKKYLLEPLEKKDISKAYLFCIDTDTFSLKFLESVNTCVDCKKVHYDFNGKTILQNCQIFCDVCDSQELHEHKKTEVDGEASCRFCLVNYGSSHPLKRRDRCAFKLNVLEDFIFQTRTLFLTKKDPYGKKAFKMESESFPTLSESTPSVSSAPTAWNKDKSVKEEDISVFLKASQETMARLQEKIAKLEETKTVPPKAETSSKKFKVKMTEPDSVKKGIKMANFLWRLNTPFVLKEVDLVSHKDNTYFFLLRGENFLEHVSVCVTIEDP